MATRFFLAIATMIMASSAVGIAQNRDARAERFVLDDNNGNTVAIQTATGPITGGTLTIPDPAGSGSFLITTPSSGSQSVSGHLLPGTTNTFDLGSGTFLWRSLFLGSNAQIGGALRLVEPGGSDYSAFVAQAQANNITYTLPAVNGSAGQVLRVASSPAPTSTAATLEWGAGSSGWSLTGNAGLTDGTDNFFGTTSGVPVRFITSNTERMRLTSAGVLGLGTTTPDANAILELERTSATLNTSGTYTAQRIDYSSQGTGPVITLYGLYTDVYGTDDSAIGMHVIARGGNNVAGRFVATGGGLGIHVAQGNVLLSNAGTASELRMAEPSGSGTEYTAFKAQAQANNITYTLPAANGTDGQVLRLATGATATAGTLEWAAASGLTLPFSSTTSSASTLFDITNSGAGQAANFNISGAKTASTTTAVVDNDATNTTTDAINKTVLSVASSGDFSGAGGGSTTAIGLDVNMTGTGGDLNRGVKIAVAGNDAVGLQISSGRVQLSVATITYATTMTAPNNAAIIRVLDSGGNTGNSTLTLSTTDIAEGQICWVYNSDTNDNVVVQSTPTRTISSGATNRDLWQFIYIDGAWRPLR